LVCYHSKAVVKNFSNFFTDDAMPQACADNLRNEFVRFAVYTSFDFMRYSMKKIHLLLCVASIAFPARHVLAQPAPQAEITPQPAQRIKPNKAAQAARKAAQKEVADKRDQRAIEEFETLFGRKLTDEQKTLLKKAAEERNEAALAAQQAYRIEFAKITGVTQKEFQAKRREARRKDKAAPDGAADIQEQRVNKAGKPVRRGDKPTPHPGNLPDGTPADAPTPAAQ
jgi:hypothetical protein